MRRKDYRISASAKQVEISDKFSPAKVHVFRIYQDYHVTYNQRIFGSIFYSRFQRVNMNFGYAEYLSVAKSL